ncbi:putative O-methyltransferase domain, plant methyltransferase dimerization [Helianthus annuus]|nr:putative O-methyltransferase domain, plant methyltransferase dimerization [Helianthus annuus]
MSNYLLRYREILRINLEMALQNGELSKDQLLDSQAHIWNHIYSYINSMSLKCAVQLKIPDIINRHGSPMLLSELVKALGINKERTPFVYRLMRILIHSGFFLKHSVSTTPGDNDEEGGEGYLLAPASRLLLKEDPLSLRSYLLAAMDPLMLDPWQHMSKWFQNDDVTPFYTTHGKMFWDMASQESKLNQFFNEAMASDSRLVTSVILKHCGSVFEAIDSIVDVGGGTGTVVEAIAKAFPNIRCINFDLPHVVDGLVGTKNLSHVGGDMFEAIPKADAVFLKWILHDWSDEECMKILKRCREAIPSKENGGKLIIIDMVLKVDEGENDLLKTQLFLDMRMMTLVTGRERSEKEWAKLFFDAGFSDYKITPVLGLRSLIEVYPS